MTQTSALLGIFSHDGTLVTNAIRQTDADLGRFTVHSASAQGWVVIVEEMGIDGKPSIMLLHLQSSAYRDRLTRMPISIGINYQILHRAFLADGDRPLVVFDAEIAEEFERVPAVFYGNADGIHRMVPPLPTGENIREFCCNLLGVSHTGEAAVVGWTTQSSGTDLHLFVGKPNAPALVLTIPAGPDDDRDGYAIPKSPGYSLWSFSEHSRVVFAAGGGFAWNGRAWVGRTPHEVLLAYYPGLGVRIVAEGTTGLIGLPHPIAMNSAGEILYLTDRGVIRRAPPPGRNIPHEHIAGPGDLLPGPTGAPIVAVHVEAVSDGRAFENGHFVLSAEYDAGLGLIKRVLLADGDGKPRRPQLTISASLSRTDSKFIDTATIRITNRGAVPVTAELELTTWFESATSIIDGPGCSDALNICRLRIEALAPGDSVEHIYKQWHNALGATPWTAKITAVESIHPEPELDLSDNSVEFELSIKVVEPPPQPADKSKGCQAVPGETSIGVLLLVFFLRSRLRHRDVAR